MLAMRRLILLSRRVSLRDYVMYSDSHVYDVTRDLIVTNFERCTTRNKHM